MQVAVQVDDSMVEEAAELIVAMAQRGHAVDNAPLEVSHIFHQALQIGMHEMSLVWLEQVTWQETPILGAFMTLDDFSRLVSEAKASRSLGQAWWASSSQVSMTSPWQSNGLKPPRAFLTHVFWCPNPPRQGLE